MYKYTDSLLIRFSCELITIYAHHMQQTCTCCSNKTCFLKKTKNMLKPDKEAKNMTNGCFTMVQSGLRTFSMVKLDNRDHKSHMSMQSDLQDQKAML